MKLVPVGAALLSVWIAFAQADEHQPAMNPGDNGPATKAEVDEPSAIVIDGSKTLYIAQTGALRKVDLKTGIITTIQTQTPLEPINSLALDTSGNLIATEFTAGRVRRIDPNNGSVTTVAGARENEFSGDGGLAVNAGLGRPDFVTTDAGNNVYFVDSWSNRRIRRVDAKTGIITTIAGNGNPDYGGDGGLAIDAGLGYPDSVAVDRDGNLFIAQVGYQEDNHRIRRVDAKTGIITTVAGLAQTGFAPEGRPSLTARLHYPSNLIIGRMGNLYMLDNGRVRYIDAKTKRMKTVAGSPKGSAIAMDSQGTLYIADFTGQRIRRVDAHTGALHIVAGNGSPHHTYVLL